MRILIILSISLLLGRSASYGQTAYTEQLNDSIRMEYHISNSSTTDTVYERKMYKYDKLVEHLYLKNNQTIGKYRSYYDNGQRLIEGFYNKNGKADGEWLRYFKGGNIASKLNYKDGALSGLCKFYYENGKIREFGNYRSEVYNLMISGMNVPHLVESRVGIWEYYYEAGGLKAKGEFWFDEIPMRSPQEMLESMESMETGEFMKPWKVDIKHGPWIFWTTDQKINREEVYNKGELVEMLQK